MMLQAVWLHTVRCYMRLGLFFYYKKIIVVDKQHIPKKGAVLFLSNHQNALIDALLIATKSGRFSYFLTRASVFSGALVDTLLKSLQMLPVYRIRDGWSTISNNNAIFTKCATLLKAQKAVALFPEGNHNIQRTVRPLSKGFTRIVFETLDTYPDIDLQIVPIGLNFKQADAFADSVSIYFGKPLSVKPYMIADKNEAVLQLKQDVRSKISKLTTHIPVDDYNGRLDILMEKRVDFLKPKAVNNCLASNFEVCETEKLSKRKGIKRVFKIVMILALIGPYLIWNYVAKPKIQEVEFVATFRFVIAITLVPLWLILVSVFLGIFFGSSMVLLYLFLALSCALLAVKL